MNLGITLAANGAFPEGCRQMGRALKATDPAYAELLERPKLVHPVRTDLPGRSSLDHPNKIAQLSASNLPIVFYVPPKIGVGSAVLATLPFHHRSVSLVVEQRLHTVFRRMLGNQIELLSPEAEIDASRAEVLNLFDLLADVDTNTMWEASKQPLWTPDQSRVRKLKGRYSARYGTRKLVGIAWSTTNDRTGFGRNIDLSVLGNFVNSNPGIQFISLQSSKIYVIGEVVSIDCSAAHFSGALDVQTKCLLTGEPTRQWPERRSFYRSVSIVGDLHSIEIG